MRKNLIVLTAGGTGGHMFPAVALAEVLKKRGHDVVMVTDDRARQYEQRKDIFDLEIVNVRSPAGNILKKMKSALSLLKGYFKARKLLKNRMPSVVVGFGGYPSFPTMLAAQHLKYPNIIHEQNAVIGKANLVMARKSDKIAISLPKIVGLTDSEQNRVVFTGNPVRQEIRALYDEPYTIPDSQRSFTIFVLGGSQGASVFSDIVPGALARLSDYDKSRLNVIQQCRPDDIDQTVRFYQDHGIKCEVESFFHDVPYRLRTASLVIARAGGSTVAEVTTAGRPAIFVPYPWHKDQQQKMNADVVADTGGAWVMAQEGFTEEALHARLLTFLQDPVILERAGREAKNCAIPDAAEKLADLVEDQIAQ